MSLAIERLHQKLIHVLIKWDEAESRREAKRGHANIYRIGHFLKAAQDAEDQAKAAAAGGINEMIAYRDAIAEHFTPTSRIRTFLRKNVDGRVDVEHGRWVVEGVLI